MANPQTRDKDQALHDFWSGFGLMAYEENTVPDTAMADSGGHYITYNVQTGSFDERFPLSANIWYRDPSWAAICKKAQFIAEYIGSGGVLVPFADGYLWLCRGVPFSQRLADDDDTIRRIYINLMAESLSVN